MGDEAHARGAAQHLERGVGVDVRERGRAERAAPALPVAGDRDARERLTLPVHDPQLAVQVRALPGPDVEEHLEPAVAVEIGGHGLRGEADPRCGAGVQVDRPAVLLGAVQPEGVQAAVRGREHDLAQLVAVEVHDHRVRLDALDLVVVDRERRRGCVWIRCHRPVVGARGPAPAVGREDDGELEEQVVAHAGVVEVADDHGLGHAVAVEVGDDGRGARQVRPPVIAGGAPAVDVAEEVDRLLEVHAHLGPDPAVAEAPEDLAHAALRSVGLEGRQVVHVARRDHLGQAVAVEVAGAEVLVVAAGGVAEVAALEPRPARARGTVALHDAPHGRAAAGAAGEQLERAVAVEVGGRQAAQLVGRAEGLGGEARLGAPRSVQHDELAVSVADRDLEPGRAVEVGDDRARPQAPVVAARRPGPLERARGAVHGHQAVAAPEHLDLAVAVDVAHRGGGIPARVAVAGRAARPLEDRRGRQAGAGIGRERAEGEGDREEGAAARHPPRLGRAGARAR